MLPGHVMVMPGKILEPNVLMVQSAAPKLVSALAGRAQLRRRKRLGDRAVGLFPNEPEGFRDAQIGLDDLRVAERNHLAARVEMLRKARDG